MADITNSNSIGQRPGFDAAQYESLIEAAKSDYVSKDEVDKRLLNLLDQGMAFSEAVRSVQTTLPTLPPPIGKGVLWDSGLSGLPSFASNYLALISDMASESRRQSADQRAIQTEIIIDQIKEQASKMREKAIVQLCVGIATGMLSIAQGVAAGATMAKGLQGSARLDGVAKQNHDMLLNTRVASLNSAMGGVGGMMQGINQAVGGIYDSQIKNIDAIIERARAQSDMLKNLEDSMRDLFSKAVSTQDALQQNINQTRTKILG